MYQQNDHGDQYVSTQQYSSLIDYLYKIVQTRLLFVGLTLFQMCSELGGYRCLLLACCLSVVDWRTMCTINIVS